MSNYIKLTRLTKEQENALAYRKLRFSADPVPAAPPRLHSDNPFMNHEVDDDVNQLHFQFQGLPLKVQIDQFEQSQQTNPPIDGIIQFVWNGTLLNEPRYRYKTPVNPADFPFNLTLPAGLTDKAGKHELKYRINHGGNTGAVVTPLTVNVDREAPPPIKPTAPVTEITKEYLDLHGYIEVTAPLTQANKIGDVIRCWFGSRINDTVLVGTKTLESPITAPVFRLTKEMVGTEEIPKALWTDHTDRKGNRSAQSDRLHLDLVLTDPPVLVPPVVPLFDDDGVISLIDAQTVTGVGVCIKEQYVGFVSGRDYMQIIWDGKVQQEKLITGFPVFTDVHFRDVYNGVAFKDDVPVGLRVRRGNKHHPAAGPIVTLVKKDLRRPGTIDPEKPGPPDESLPLVTAKGAVTPEKNVIRKVDSTGPVTVTVPLYDGSKADEEVQLYWNGVEVPASTTPNEGGRYVVLGTEPTGFEITFTVPWALVDASGNDIDTLVHYIAFDAVADGYAVSLPTEVDVQIHDVDVSDPVFQHLDEDFGYLNCNSVRRVPVVGLAIIVFIPPDAQLADQDIELVYQAYSDAAGITPIVGVTDKVNYRVSARESIDGAYINFPFAVFDQTGSAFGAVEYTVTLGGVPTTSDRHLVQVHMKEGEGGSCVVPPLE
ncbi:hypothetical protein ACYZUC_12495 [Pseudomonas sp. GT1P32]